MELQRGVDHYAQICGALFVLVSVTMPVPPAGAADTQVTRGTYLVAAIGCSDCHTPGRPDGSPKTWSAFSAAEIAAFPFLGEVVFPVPGSDVIAPNPTPDVETGLGSWTRSQIVTVLTTGRRPDGRMLSQLMPWKHVFEFTKADANAIAAYLQSLPPVKHAVPRPSTPAIR